MVLPVHRRSGPQAAKSILRRQLRGARDAIAPADRATRSMRLCHVLLDLLAATPTPSLTIATYCPILTEVDVAPLLHSRLAKTSIRWAFPRIDQGDIHFHLGLPTCPGPMKTFEPPADSPRLGANDLDVVIVPGLGFDRRGHRLGYGAGYYDRALARLPPTTQLVGVCFHEQLIPMIPHTDGDIPMHLIVSDDQAGDAFSHPTGALP